MSAFIHFIGIVTLVSASALPPAGQHILIPRFADIISAKNNVIRVPTGAIVSSSWEKASGSPDGFTDFLIGVQTITVNGSGTLESPPLEMPHLTCCCNEMKEGLSPDYNDPDPNRQDKKSAYVPLDHGTLSQYLIGEAIHLDLEVVPVSGQITITGVRNNVTQTIVVSVPQDGEQHIVFLNSPDNTEHDDHWRSYYRMGREVSAFNDCPETPKNDKRTCGFRTTGCLATGAAAKPARTTAARMKRLKDIHDNCRACKYRVGGDINCSSSSWP